jgi:YidC/Oxa1 family membrane protein insertase
MRTAVTVLAILLGLMVAVAVFWSTATRTVPPAREASPPAAAAPAEDALAQAPTQAVPVEEPVPAADPVAIAPPTDAEAEVERPAAAALPLDGLRVLPAENATAATLGSADRVADNRYRMRVDLAPFGAGVWRMALRDYRIDVDDDRPYIVHGLLTARNPMPGQADYNVYPFAARAITINGVTVSLEHVPWSRGEVVSTGGYSSVEYRVTLADGDEPVAEVVRRFVLPIDSYDLRIEQHVVNRTRSPLQVVWEQNAQGDLPLDDAAYMGDQRLVVTGYFNLRSDPGRSSIWTDGGFLHRRNVVDGRPVWPNPSVPAQSELAWLASENRYFAVVTHLPVPADLRSASRVPPLEQRFPAVRVLTYPPGEAVRPEDRAMVFSLMTSAVTVPPGGSVDLSLGVFAGPRKRDILHAPPFAALGLPELIRYELGCTWCTFQWLARGLLRFLTFIEAGVRDWGVAIIILVLVVRLILHPITKKAQINMMKMGKQMQMLQPEVEKLRKKFGDDQSKLNAEMMKLYREKGVNPANMLGCLPMFLQMPIWIALYAMLYFAIELRHEPAFYGVFQWMGSMFGADWPFLADLSTADHFIPLPGEGFRIPLPFVDNRFDAINVLPLLMGVVFYLNMKFTTPPPPEGKLTEQQEMMLRQQKIMRIVFPFLMPVFLYSAPSGLTLYICASTFAGIIDSYIVRRHLKQLEAEGKLFEQKPRNPNSFMARLARAAENKQREMMERQQAAQQGKGKGPRRR